MRTRKIRSPPLGFSLALPPPSVVGEVRVQPGNELFVNVDDTNISPIITVGEALPAGQLVHVTNTNLFVLVDGVSLFANVNAARREEPQPVHSGGLVDGGAVEAEGKASSPPSVNRGPAPADSVEAAIQGIEDGDDEAHKRSGISFSLSPKVDNDTPIIAPYSSHYRRLSRGGKGVSRRKGATVPREYLSLFTNGSDLISKCVTSASDVDWTGTPENAQDASRIKVHGFLPWYVVERNRIRFSRHHNGSMSDTVRGTMGVTLVSSQSSGPSACTNTTAGGKCSNTAWKGNNVLFGRRKGVNSKSASLHDVGRSIRSLDLEEVELLEFVGKGTQGAVHRVVLDNKLYGLKCIDVGELTGATSLVERQSRKDGLVKELNMIRLQRSRNPPEYLLRLFDACVTRNCEKQHLHILMELMSFSVEDAQRMVSRIPSEEMMKLTQLTFQNHMTGSSRVKLQWDDFAQKNSGLCTHFTGRRSYKIPEEWEMSIDRQTPVPEIVLSMLAADVLRGLKELHEDYTIVHCDIKPANILVDHSMARFRLADFGCGCQMDPKSRKAQPVVFDLGSKLYKAPERLIDELYGANVEGSLPQVQFTFAADVWSLGVTLLELRNGVHPCYPFKSDYWNYRSNLKLSRMVKPVSWSPYLHDFIEHCLKRKAEQRWGIDKLLQHPFIERYSQVPRTKLKAWMARLKSESETFQRRQQRELLAEQILLSTGRKGPDMYRHRSRSIWENFTNFLKAAPHYQDVEKFPQLC